MRGPLEGLSNRGLSNEGLGYLITLSSVLFKSKRGLSNRGGPLMGGGYLPDSTVVVILA